MCGQNGVQSDSPNRAQAAKISGMAHKWGGLLAQIQADVVDHTVLLSSILQKCIVLGGEAGSEKMRDWARQELNGYEDETVPKYRRLPAVLMVMITNSAGYNGRSVRLDPAVFPDQIHDMLREKDIDLDNMVFNGGIGELEALAEQKTDEHRFLPSFGGVPPTYVSIGLVVLTQLNSAIAPRIPFISRF